MPSAVTPVFHCYLPQGPACLEDNIGRLTALADPEQDRPGPEYFQTATIVDDLAAGDLARRIARRLEEDLNYPGQIEVTVIREFRATDYAR